MSAEDNNEDVGHKDDIILECVRIQAQVQIHNKEVARMELLPGLHIQAASDTFQGLSALARDRILLLLGVLSYSWTVPRN